MALIALSDKRNSSTGTTNDTQIEVSFYNHDNTYNYK